MPSNRARRGRQLSTTVTRMILCTTVGVPISEVVPSRFISPASVVPTTGGVVADGDHRAAPEGYVGLVPTGMRIHGNRSWYCQFRYS